MKRLLSVFVIIIAAAVLSACDGGNTVSDAPANEQITADTSENSETADPTAVPDDTTDAEPTEDTGFDLPMVPV